MPLEEEHTEFQDIVPVTQETREEQYGGMVAIAIMLVAVTCFVLGLTAGIVLVTILAH